MARERQPFLLHGKDRFRLVTMRLRLPSDRLSELAAAVGNGVSAASKGLTGDQRGMLLAGAPRLPVVGVLAKLIANRTVGILTHRSARHWTKRQTHRRTDFAGYDFRSWGREG